MSPAVGHLGFSIGPKVTTLGWQIAMIIHIISIPSSMLYGRRRSLFPANQVLWLWQPYWITDELSNNNWSEPCQEHFCKYDSIHPVVLEKKFDLHISHRISYVKLYSTLAAILDFNRSKVTTLGWQLAMIIHDNFNSILHVVLERRS
ncbi:MAG: hypothetical protein H0A75_06525 [Candidatus Methanofishera endochildressiae]|uniref:Uncharacterized protein n=1 Tax=Candidatus Methanofishera endochildressiae TaxID=2738884 RepID=A0A7Z0SD60_9GAMM|nr:hypothetical protein [Candidatus Methanofishera endochildressiae]